MAHRVSALVGFPRVMGKVAAQFGAARVVRIGYGLAVVPLTVELLREMIKASPDGGRWTKVAGQEDCGFVGIRTQEWAAHFSQHGQVGVMVWTPGKVPENEEGTLWVDGMRWELFEKPGEEMPVDGVLLGLGVRPEEGSDAFNSLGFEKIKATEDWLKKKAPKPEGDVPTGRWELDGGVIRIFSEPGVEAMVVRVDDVMAVGEMTDVGGPFADDWWLVVCLRDGSWIRWLVSSPGTHMDELLRGLSELWGVKLELELAHSVVFHSRVMWPGMLKERLMFEILPDRPETGWRGWLGMTAPEEYVLTKELKAWLVDGK
jgi:hypothetical protein